jgi:hypothetical protein
MANLGWRHRLDLILRIRVVGPEGLGAIPHACSSCKIQTLATRGQWGAGATRRDFRSRRSRLAT